MIYFDANRDILCFGMNDDGFEQITFLIEKPDRANEAAARDNLLAHFPKLKRMEVTFVIKTSRCARNSCSQQVAV
jgi:hypothetical protein